MHNKVIKPYIYKLHKIRLILYNYKEYQLEIVAGKKKTYMICYFKVGHVKNVETS